MNKHNLSKKRFRYPDFIVFFMILITLSMSGYSQSEFMVTPGQVNLPSSEGFAEVQLRFSGAPFPWRVSFDASWLKVTPTTGTNNANLVIEYAANNHLRRKAELLFTATNGSGTRLVVEVWQMQALPAETLSTRFEYLDQDPAIQELMPYTGQFNFTYTPWETGVWLNVLAKSELVKDPVWIIPNVYLPDQSWTDKLQQMSVCFNLEELGYQVGEPVPNLQFAYTLSTHPDKTAPMMRNELFMNTLPVIFTKPIFTGYDSPLLFNTPHLISFFPTTGFDIPFIPDDYYHT